LERASGLGRAIVADRLATLTRLGLTREDEFGQATGGRAPRLARFRADAGVLLVGMVEPGSIAVGVADLSGRLLVEHHESAEVATDTDRSLKRLGTLFDWMLEQYKGKGDVWGIGVAVPGPPDTAAGRSMVSGMARRYRATVSVHSSVQMRTLGEWRAGTGIGIANLIFVDLGREIAAGLLANGKLVLGAQGAAGIIGHVPAGEGDHTPCRCGNTGCLEVVAGADAIRRESLRAARDGRSPYLAEIISNDDVSVADVGLTAQRGDPFSAELLSRCGRQIGTVLAALANAFNPSLIVLGGEVAETGDILLAAVREAVYRRSHPLVTRDLRIVRSQMGNSSGLVGAALTLIDSYFEPEFLEGWIATGSPSRHPDVIAEIAGTGETAERANRRPGPPPEKALRTGT
jgi:predicted NBD/HSP70 family sugar kinase